MTRQAQQNVAAQGAGRSDPAGSQRMGVPAVCAAGVLGGAQCVGESGSGQAVWAGVREGFLRASHSLKDSAQVRWARAW